MLSLTMKTTSKINVFWIIWHMSIIYHSSTQGMNSDIIHSNSISKPWDWNTLSWHNAQENTDSWHNIGAEVQQKLLTQFSEVYYCFFQKKGAQNWGITINNDGTVEGIERNDLHCIWHASKNMGQVNKTFYTHFKINYHIFMNFMCESNTNVSFGLSLDRCFLNNVPDSNGYNILMFDMLAYRMRDENCQKNTFKLNDNCEFQSPCIAHNISLARVSNTSNRNNDSLLAKKLVFLSNRMRFFYDNSAVYSIVTYNELSMTKEFITECVKNDYLPIQTEYFTNYGGKHLGCCNTLLLLPLHMEYSTSHDGKLIKKLTLPLAHNNETKVENNKLRAKCYSLIYKNQLLQERLDLLVPLFERLKYFNDSVKEALKKFAAYPLEKALEAKNMIKLLRDNIKKMEKKFKITIGHFEKEIKEKDLIIERLKKDHIKKDNKIASDIEIINNYITEKSKLSKENALLNLEVASYKRKIDKIQIEKSKLLKKNIELESKVSLDEEIIKKIQAEREIEKKELNQKLEATNADNKTAITTLTEVLRSANKSNQEYLNKISLLTDENGTLQKEKNNLQSINATLNELNKQNSNRPNAIIDWIFTGSLCLNVFLLSILWQLWPLIYQG